MKTSIKQQLEEYNERKYHKIFSNALIRIKTTHFIATSCLVFNSLVFTDNIHSIIIQLVLAVIVVLHDFDDQYLKTVLTKTINKLNNSNLNLQKSNDKLKKLSTIDFLTNIPNRRYFFDMGEKQFHLAQRENSSLALLFLDVDHFKKINDNYGHAIGDGILKLIAITMSNTIRKSDLHARIGGEEFAILLINTDKDGAKLFCETIKNEIEKTIFRQDDFEINVTASIGLTVLKHHDESLDDMFKRADEALYISKKQGRNQINTNF